jgi:hypothetical protein
MAGLVGTRLKYHRVHAHSLESLGVWRGLMALRVSMYASVCVVLSDASMSDSLVVAIALTWTVSQIFITVSRLSHSVNCQ